jgi:aspartate/methionine/tyrosine aminotransferase
MYDGATPYNVLVTVGAIEANYIATRTLLDPGDEIVIMLPNYMQIWGIAKNHGLQIRTFHLREDNGWAPDLDELNQAVTPATKLIAVCNPDNPTGYAFTDTEMDAIVAAADSSGAWILADEVYRGAERTVEEQTPSFYGRYDKVLAMGSMSKAYGMPGLRIGWVVGPPDTLDEIWARHEYTTISATMLSNKLAAIALSPEVRPRIIERTRDYIRKGYPVLLQWMDSHKNTFSFTPPQAAAITFVRYHLDINSTDFTERLRREKSVLIVPGDHFGMDNFVRISFGLPHDYLTAALGRIHELIEELKA